MLRSATKLLIGPLLALAVTGGALLVDTTAAEAATTATIKVSGKLKVRGGPTNGAKLIRTLKNKQKISLDCRVNGQYVRGTVRKTAQWDHIAGTAQYVSHAYVVTKANIPACAPPPSAAKAPVAAAKLPVAAVPAGPTGTMTNDQFLATSVGPAQQSQAMTGVPASVTLAQAILESGWGRSALSANDRNFFGMKCFTQGSYANACRTYVTSECTTGGVCYTTSAIFRSYPSSLASFADHGANLKNLTRYANAFKFTKNPNQFAEEIRKGGYATDPNYTTKLVALMVKYNLYRYDAK